MAGELVMGNVQSGLLISKQFNSVTLIFQSEEEAELFYIAITEAERKQSFVKLEFNRHEPTKNL